MQQLTGFIYLSLFGLLVSSHVAYFNTRNKILTAKLLKQGYRYHKLRKTFFLNSIDATMTWYQLKSILKQGLSELGFYGDSV